MMAQPKRLLPARLLAGPASGMSRWRAFFCWSTTFCWAQHFLNHPGTATRSAGEATSALAPITIRIPNRKPPAISGSSY